MLFIVKTFDGLTPPKLMTFDLEVLWTQLYNLPLMCMPSKIRMQIMKTVGKVYKINVKEDGIGWGHYLKVKIKIKIEIEIGKTYI